MIFYDSNNWASIIRVRGSVFPRAILYAIPAAMAAGGVKFLEWHTDSSISLTNVGSSATSSTVYSGFTFVLGFVLVFRASQSYARYWLAATSVRLMQAEWMTACSTLIAFSKVSKKTQQDVMVFVHTAIRLFALIHAMALEEIADFDDFPLLDIQAFSSDDVSVLSAETNAGRKVELVFHWIQVHIVRNVESGLLSCPPPLLTRVFQNLGNGLVNYYGAQQVVIWPFPFAYAQMNSILVFVHSIVTPIVASGWTSAIWSCSLFTFLSVGCMMCLDLIAIELENPFGNDDNDLPVHEMQRNFIEDLTMLVDPRVWRVPKLLPRARMHDSLSVKDNEMSLLEYARTSAGIDGGSQENLDGQAGKEAEFKAKGRKNSQKGHGPSSLRSFARSASMQFARAHEHGGSMTPCIEQKDGAHGPHVFEDVESPKGAPPPVPATPPTVEPPKTEIALTVNGTPNDLKPSALLQEPGREPSAPVLTEEGANFTVTPRGAKEPTSFAAILKEQHELLEQQRDVSEQHLRQDSAFQERVLSLLEQLRVDPPSKELQNWMEPRSPRWEVRSPRDQGPTLRDKDRRGTRTAAAKQGTQKAIPSTSQSRGSLPMCGPCTVSA